MIVYNGELPLSPGNNIEDQSSHGLISPPISHENCDKIQDDQKACVGYKKSVSTSLQSLARSSRKARKSTARNDRILSARAVGGRVADTANCPSQRLDAMTYFESQPSTTIAGDPNQALWFTTDSVNNAAVALWKEMQMSSAFREYSENKEKPKNRKRKAAPWPRELEYTFCHALVRWPPIGKKKIFYNGKKRGKNELLLEYIKEQGTILDHRKVISSHLQNIRPFFLDNPKVLRYFPEDKSRETNSNNQQSKCSKTRKFHRRSASAKRESSIESDLVRAETHLRIHTLIPYYFEMFVTDPRRDMPTCLHVFTKSDLSSQLPDVQLQDIKNKETLIQPLSAFIQSSLPLCQVIICEASLDVLRGSLPNGADLGIQFEFTSKSDLQSYEFQCFTSIFDGQECVDSSSGHIGYDAEGSKRLHKIPFGSNFWARKMGGFNKSIREVERRRNVSAAEDVEELQQLEDNTEKRIAGSINSLSATQDIFAISKTDGHTEHVLLVHWTFKYVKRSLDATTTWRNLDVSELRSCKVSPEEEDASSNVPENVNPSSNSLLPLSDNDMVSSTIKQISTYNESPSHLSIFDSLPEHATADTDEDIVKNATNVAEQAGFAVMNTANAVAPEISETRHLKNFNYLASHGNLEITDRNGNECSAADEASDIDAEQSALNIQVGFSQDIYELSQPALSHTQEIVHPVSPQSLSRSLSNNLSQSVSQQDPYYQGDTYQTAFNHDYSYHNLPQHIPRAVNMETEAVESHLICSNWQSDDLAFASNPLGIAHNHSSQLQGIDWQTAGAVNIMDTTMYKYKDQQNQLCSFG